MYEDICGVHFSGEVLNPLDFVATDVLLLFVCSLFGLICFFFFL